MQDPRSWNKFISTAGLAERAEIGHVIAHVQHDATEAQDGPGHDDGIYVIRTNQGNLKARKR
jgi:hypothetical protein